MSSSVCRYFATTGNCFYGDQCNYIHAYPQAAATAASTTSVASAPAYIPKSQRPCRNIALHGFCKFAGKGCEYAHDLLVRNDEGLGVEGAAAGAAVQPLPAASSAAALLGGASTLASSKQNLLAAEPFTPSLGSYAPTATAAAAAAAVGGLDGATSASSTSTSKLAAAYARAGTPTFTPSYDEDDYDYLHPATAQPAPYSRYNFVNEGAPAMPSSMGMAPGTQAGAAPAGGFYRPSGVPPAKASAVTSVPPRMTPPPYFPESMAAAAAASSARSGFVDSVSSYTPSSMAAALVAQQQQQQQQRVPERESGAAGSSGFFYAGANPPASTSTSSAIRNPTRSPSPGMGSQHRYNPYTATLPHVAARSNTGRRPVQSFFMAEDLRQQFLLRSASVLARPEADDPRAKEIPATLHRYHSLNPLEDAIREQISRVFGFSMSVYKAISSVDGMPYFLRRLDGVRIAAEYTLGVVDIWRQVQHPNVVTLREAFQAKEWPGLFLAYDYHPCAVSLEKYHFSMHPSYIPEDVLWSYITQLASGIRAIHAAGLACRVVTLSKVILTGRNRVRISGVAIKDVVSYDAHSKLPQYQQEDILSLGKLILTLACKSTSAVSNVIKSLEYVSAHYSPELCDFLRITLAQSINYPTIDELCKIISTRMLREMEHLQHYNDLLESELSKEVENGRLFRVVCKLGFINERPEFGVDPRWSETGDRYLLKLFRDYVFHQVYDDGNPAVDLGHVVDTLNKLDVGCAEKVALMTRDEKSILVVSYKDIKRCVESAFAELLQKQEGPNYRL